MPDTDRRSHTSAGRRPPSGCMNRSVTGRTAAERRAINDGSIPESSRVFQLAWMLMRASIVFISSRANGGSQSS